MRIVLSGLCPDNELHTARRSCARVKRGNPVADTKAKDKQDKAYACCADASISLICMQE